MKNVISYLKALWSRVAGSQRNDVEFDRRLTVGSPSGFTINWTLTDYRHRKCVGSENYLYFYF